MMSRDDGGGRIARIVMYSRRLPQPPMPPIQHSMCRIVPSFRQNLNSGPILLALLVVLFSVIAAPVSLAQAVKIMPLGDSITRGSNGNGAIPGGYRQQLGVKIAEAGRSYDFVGIRTDNAAVGMDPHHNGRDGWRTDQVLGSLTTYLAANPNVVLMHLGTNDLLQAVPTATVITNMTTLIQRITSHSTSPKLYVATIIPVLADRDGKTKEQWATIINDYNSKVRVLVQQQLALGRNVSLVDFASSLNFTIGTSTSHFYHIYDGTHPNQNGYNQMGDFWYNAIIAGGSFGVVPPSGGTGGTNLALGKPSSASSFYDAPYSAAKANDGKSDTIWAALSNDTAPSWTVDLGANYNIQRVEIVSRQNLDQSLTRENFEIRGSVTSNFLTYEVLATQGTPPFSHMGTWNAAVSNTNAFRYIRVAKTDGAYFAFAEVRVFGTTPTAGPQSVTLNVTSSTGTGLNVAVSPSDLDGAGNGTTSFTRRYNAGTSVSLTAPTTSGVSSFVKWQLNGADLTSSNTATLTLSATSTLNAVYAAPPTSNLQFVNGSFELDFTGWTRSGSQGIGVGSTLLPPDGQKVVIFNGSNETPSGVISQSFPTSPGTSYQVAFKVGVLSYNSQQQKIQVTATGSGTLLSQTITQTGTGNGVPRWLTYSYGFVANSAATTLSFSDRSTVTNSLDLLLDNVTLSGGSPPVNTAPVAGSDNYSTAKGTALTVPTPGVLANDSDAQSNPLTAQLVTGVSNGTLSLNSNGSFGYQPASGFAGTDTFTYRASDGSLASNVATVTINVQPAPTASLANGSFEGGLAGWTASGAVDLQNQAPYLASNGSRLVSFNAANQAITGLLSQTFATNAGVSYQLDFDLGVLAYNTLYQKMLVTATGTSPLLSQAVSVRGVGGGATRWYAQRFTFVANSSTTTLSFRDQSASTSNLDLLLDHIRVSPLPSPAALLAVVPEGNDNGDSSQAVVTPDLPGLGQVKIAGAPDGRKFQLQAVSPGLYFLERSVDLMNWNRVEGSEFDVTEPSLLDFQDPTPKGVDETRMFYRIGFVEANLLN